MMIPPKPILLTLGDPTGIGPELILRSVEGPDRLGAAAVRTGEIPMLAESNVPMIAVGRASVLRAHARALGLSPEIAVVDGEEPLPATYPPGVLHLIEPPGEEPPTTWKIGGPPDANAGRLAAEAIRLAADWCRRGIARAMVTAPIHKESLALAGEPFPGHTEMLAAACGLGEKDVAMMLAGGGLRVVLATIHCALADVPKRLTIDHLTGLFDLIARSYGCGRATHLFVCGLNPHAGEHGLFGREEIDIIAPAIEQARARGLEISGPHPGDTVFHRAQQQTGAVVVAMYHDQGLIPIKTLDFDGGVNITLGLPFVRTSPDHGTACDIAGQGVARLGSWHAAIEQAFALTS